MSCDWRMIAGALILTLATAPCGGADEPQAHLAQLRAHWLPDGAAFWYRAERASGTRSFVHVDAEAGTLEFLCLEPIGEDEQRPETHLVEHFCFPTRELLWRYRRELTTRRPDDSGKSVTGRRIE